MSQETIFGFSSHCAAVSETIDAIRLFASAKALRSAMVEELDLDGDFYRRPLRPEDLSFIDFTMPVTEQTVTRLPFLAAQRILLTINELGFARMPRNGSAASVQEAAAFYMAQNPQITTRIKPFLESFSFNMLESGVLASRTDVVALFDDATTAWEAFWDDTLTYLDGAHYLEDGLRFALIQNQGLAVSKRSALEGAIAAGYFGALPPALYPWMVQKSEGLEGSEQLARELDVAKREHSYWQFYLSTSLAFCNLLHALRDRPAHALRFVGAAFVADAEAIAFARMADEGKRVLGISGFGNAAVLDALSNLHARFGAAVEIVTREYGPWGLSELTAGISMAAALGRLARANLGEQLRWLSSIERYRDLAHSIDARIQRECPDIDRETFVEPREMCSTTHVHDDHRLVVIESGDMVFWGNVGMILRLKPGEMVLVPQGRLHGSSIESDTCVYHQPIIPDSWVDMVNT